MDANTTIEYLRTLVAGVDRGEWTTDQAFGRLRELLAPERLCPARPWSEMQSTGLLWYLNRTALWPRGYAFALITDADGTILGWDVTGDGTEPISSQADTETGRLAAVEALLAAAPHPR